MLTILFYWLIAQKTPETAEGVESLGCLDNCMGINPSKTKVMQFSHPLKPLCTRILRRVS